MSWHGGESDIFFDMACVTNFVWDFHEQNLKEPRGGNVDGWIQQASSRCSFCAH